MTNTPVYQTEKRTVCPFDGVTECKHVLSQGTHIWTCENCPFVGFEYLGKSDLVNLTSYLNR